MCRLVPVLVSLVCSVAVVTVDAEQFALQKDSLGNDPLSDSTCQAWAFQNAKRLPDSTCSANDPNTPPDTYCWMTMDCIKCSDYEAIVGHQIHTPDGSADVCAGNTELYPLYLKLEKTTYLNQPVIMASTSETDSCSSDNPYVEQAIKNGEAKDMGGPCSSDSDCSTGSCTTYITGTDVCECTSDAQCGKSDSGTAYKCAQYTFETNSCQEPWAGGAEITPVAQIPKYNQIPIPQQQCTYCDVMWVYTWVAGTPNALQEADHLSNGLGFGGWIGIIVAILLLCVCACAGAAVAREATRSGTTCLEAFKTKIDGIRHQSAEAVEPAYAKMDA